jgi:hypothetical protein
MDAMKTIESLAAIARHETAPSPDVTKDVMNQIQNYRIRRKIIPRDLGWFAAVSAVAAAVAVFFAAQAWWAMSDPLSIFFKPFFLATL